MNLVVGSPESGCAGRQHQIRFSQRIDHIRRADVVRLQFRRIDVDHHLAEFAAERMRNLNTLSPPILLRTA